MRSLAGVSSQWAHWLLISFLGLLIMGMPIPIKSQPPREQIFQIQASRFAYSPSVLKVNQGDRVTIELTSMDVVHGLAVDTYAIETRADPGQTSRVTFIANQSGSFRLRCSVVCGGMHPFMIGKLQVGRNDLLWRSLGVAVLLAVAAAWKSLS